MGALFWSFSTDPGKQAASQAALMAAHFNITGEKLKKPDEPKQKPQEIPVDTDMDNEEIQRFISRPPKHMKRVT